MRSLRAAAFDTEVFDITGGAPLTERIADFASPLTRMLLSGDGLTTTALHALTGAAPRVRLLRADRIPAGRAGRPVPALLEIGEEQGVLTRHSALTGPGGRWLSVNRVAARDDLLPEIRPLLADGRLPIGAALHAAGTGHRRTVLDAGRRRWPSGEPACYKTYLLWHGDRPLVLVNELFHPSLVSP
ncbi:chorismate--pyruvate lyase family protein [Streptomyces xiamenensis]